jgi:hypothetical protein
MNTKALTKHYDTFSPWERLPLICAASVQGDEVERERLARSAPSLMFRVPDYYGLSDGLRSLAIVHVLICLDLVARFWHAEGVLTEATLLKRQASAKRLYRALQMLAFKLVRAVTVWQTFCAEMSIDGEPMLDYLPGYETVKHAAERMKSLAFAEAEAQAYVQEIGGPHVRIGSLAEAVAEMREYLASHLAEWS